jgi:single-strand DNA-binding protein
VLLIGNLTRSPELIFAPSGTAVCKFGLAVNKTYKEKKEVCFVDVTAFGKTAEFIAQYFDRGHNIIVQGELVLEQWEKDGVKHSKHSIKADKVSFGESKKEDSHV